MRISTLPTADHPQKQPPEGCLTTVHNPHRTRRWSRSAFLRAVSSARSMILELRALRARRGWN